MTTTTGTATATATCPAGTSLLGGGGTAAAVNNAGALVFLYQSYPERARHLDCQRATQPHLR